jgi:hypothetical protein
MTKPRPIAAPIMPMPFARSAGVVVSETTACAEPRFAEPSPPMKRATSSSANVPDSADSADDTASITSDQRITGRRP